MGSNYNQVESLQLPEKLTFGELYEYEFPITPSSFVIFKPKDIPQVNFSGFVVIWPNQEDLEIERIPD